MEILSQVKITDLLSLLTALIAVVISTVSLVRTRRIAAEQLRLQKRQAEMAEATLEWTNAQRMQNAAAAELPPISVTIFPVTIHFDDGSIEDTVARITIENPSSRVRSIPELQVGILSDPLDRVPRISIEVQKRDELVKFPIEIAANSSITVYAYGRYLKKAYDQVFKSDQADLKTLVLHGRIAGVTDPLRLSIGHFDGVRISNVNGG
jgi:hypothetical protein